MTYEVRIDQEALEDITGEEIDRDGIYRLAPLRNVDTLIHLKGEVNL